MPDDLEDPASTDSQEVPGSYFDEDRHGHQSATGPHAEQAPRLIRGEPQNEGFKEEVEEILSAEQEMLMEQYVELLKLLLQIVYWMSEKMPDEPNARRKLAAFGAFGSILSTLIMYKFAFGRFPDVDTEMVSALIGAIRSMLMSGADEMLTRHRNGQNHTEAGNFEHTVQSELEHVESSLEDRIDTAQSAVAEHESNSDSKNGQLP